MKYSLYIIGAFLLLSCKNAKQSINFSKEKQTIDNVLSQWHVAASKANFDDYFELMADDAIFIGTDATENWQIKDFKSFSKPYFDKGKAWSFKAIERSIFLAKNKKIAWFDELLDTWMGTCRGSGVLRKEKDQWKIVQYVLSVTIPNNVINDVSELKQNQDSILLRIKNDGVIINRNLE